MGLRHRWNFAPLCALDSGTGISERTVILCSLNISWPAQSPKLDVDPIRIEFTWPSHHCSAVFHIAWQANSKRLHVRNWFQPTTRFKKLHKNASLYLDQQKPRKRSLSPTNSCRFSYIFFLPFCRGAVSPVINSTSPAWNTGSSTTKKSPPREFCERSQEPCEARSAWKLGWSQGDHESQVKISINKLNWTHLTNPTHSHHFYCVGMFGTDFCQSKLPLGMSTWNGPRNSREVKRHRLGIILSWWSPQNGSSWPSNYKFNNSLPYQMSIYVICGCLQTKNSCNWLPIAR